MVIIKITFLLSLFMCSLVCIEYTRKLIYSWPCFDTEKCILLSF